MTQTNLAVWVGADAAHRRQLGSVPRATEPAGVRATGGWFTCKNQKISEKKLALHKPNCRKQERGMHCCCLPVCSLNSTIAFMVLESARAMSQKSLVLPQPSWRSTLMASSSSLNTCGRKKRKGHQGSDETSAMITKRTNLTRPHNSKIVTHKPVSGESACVGAGGGSGRSRCTGCRRCCTG